MTKPHIRMAQGCWWCTVIHPFRGYLVAYGESAAEAYLHLMNGIYGLGPKP